MGKYGTIIPVVLFAALLAPCSSRAQSTFFLRVAPEAARLSVEHVNTVTIRGHSSSSMAFSSDLTLALSVSVGVRATLPGGWLAGGEIEGIIPSRRRIEGTIQPNPAGLVWEVWPGRWDFADQYGMGGTLLVGRRLGAGGPDGYLIAGFRRYRTEFAAGGENPATGEFREDRDRFDRWPWTLGVGAALPGKWPVDIRVRYSRSHFDWGIAQGSQRRDYRYSTSALSISVGVRVPG